MPCLADRGRCRRCVMVGFAVLAIAMLVGERMAHASEFGVSTYRPGIMDLSTGFLPPPGHLLLKEYFLFFDAHAKAVSEDGRIEAQADTDTYTDALFAAYTSELKVAGANLGFGTIVQLRIASQSARVGLGGGPLPEQRTTIGGLGDLIVLPVMLGWNFGQFHLSAALAFYAPTGNYQAGRIVDIGVNRWAIEPDIGFTWMDEERGHEISLFTGYTINAENSASHYSSGDEFHADFAVAQHLPYRFIAGMAGYAVQQTTPDTGRNAVLGSFKGRVIALGPLIGKTFLIGGMPVTFTAKYEFEFAAQNRSSGDALWLACTLML